MTQYETLTNILQSRYSCRAYKPDPVPRDVVDQIVTAAGRVASCIKCHEDADNDRRFGLQ